MSTSGGPAMEGISDLMRCYICMDKLTKATLCPHCSKLGCFECIKRWVTDNRSDCPHCRKSLTMNDLIKIPQFDDLQSVLDALPSSVPPDMVSKSVEVMCSTHDEKTQVYCETCRERVCHKCAIWGPHNGHSLKPLDDFYKRHVEVLQEELSKLNNRLKEIVFEVKQVETKMESVKINKSKTKREMTHLVEKKCYHLDEQARDRLEQLKKFHEYLCTHAVELKKESHDLERIISAGNVSSLLNSSGDLKSDISLRINKLLLSSNKMDSMSSISHFTNEVIPEYDHAIFKMTNFRELQRKGKEIYSDPLKVQGLVWRLKVYPNGHKEEIGNYLAVFVELSEGYSRNANYQYCIEMLYGCSNKSSQRNYKKEYMSEFADGESWGYLKYYELALLQEHGFLRDNTVVLKFHIRPPTYYQKYHDQGMFLQKVIKERNALKQQVSSLKSDYKVLQSEHRTCSQLTASSQTTQHSTRSTHSHAGHHTSHSTLPVHVPQPHPSITNSPRVHSEQPCRERTQGSSSKTIHRAPLHQSSPSRGRAHPSNHSRTPSSSASAVSSAHGIQEGVHLVTADPLLSTSQMFLRSPQHPAEFSKMEERRRKSVDSPRVSDRKSTEQHRPAQQSRSLLPGHSPNLQHQDPSVSQTWDDGIINVEDITITVDDKNSDKNKSTSSSSTLIEDESLTPLETKKELSALEGVTDRLQQQEMLQVLSQEPFGADDQKDMISLTTQDQHTALPLSNYYEPYYSEEQDTFPQPSHIFKMEHSQPNNYQILSQPNSATPPKSRHGKSLTDLTGSNGSLSCSQPFLSQSIADFQHMQRHLESSRHFGNGQRHVQGYRPHPPSRMSSDPYLNKPRPPGLKNSVLHALRENSAAKHNYSMAKKGVTGPGHHSDTQSQPPRTSRSSGHPSQSRHMKGNGSLVQRRPSSKKSPSEKKKQGALGPLMESEASLLTRRNQPEDSLASTWEKLTQESEAGSNTLTVPKTKSHKERDDHLLADSQLSTHTETQQTLTSEAKSKSYSTSSLNNLSLIL